MHKQKHKPISRKKAKKATDHLRRGAWTKFTLWNCTPSSSSATYDVVYIFAHVYKCVMAIDYRGRARHTPPRLTNTHTHTVTQILAVPNVASWRDKLIKMIFMFAHLQSPLRLSLWDDFYSIQSNRRYCVRSHSIMSDRSTSWMTTMNFIPFDKLKINTKTQRISENRIRRPALTIWISSFHPIRTLSILLLFHLIPKPCVLTCDSSPSSENRLNRFDGCKTTVCPTPTDSIAKRWQSETEHIDSPLALPSTLTLHSLLEAHSCLSSWSFCVCVCSALRTSIYNRTPSVKLLLLQFSTYARTSKWLCVRLLFCQRMPGYFSFATRESK